MKISREKLQLFQSRDLVAERFLERHQREIGAEKADEIACSITQGLQYFSAAADAAPLIKPLLQYYGCVALARALILFSDVQAREATLKPGHGLSSVSWQSQLSSGLNAMPQLTAKTTAGTFDELVRATSNFNQFEVDLSPYPSRVLLRQVQVTDLKDASFSLVDCLARLPQLRRHFYECLRIQPASYRASIFVSDHRKVDGKLKASISLVDDEVTKVDVEMASRCLGLDPSVFSQSGSIEGFSTVGYTHMTDDWQHLVTAIPRGSNFSGRDYVVLPFESGISLGKLHILYLASYFLGMLVRYHARSWAQLASRVKGDRIMPLLEAAGRVIEQDYPEAVVEHLLQESTFAGRGWA